MAGSRVTVQVTQSRFIPSSRHLIRGERKGARNHLLQARVLALGELLVAAALAAGAEALRMHHI